MIVTISEDLNSGKRDPFRFCAAVDGDTNSERGGFGTTEATALTQLARQFGKTAPVFLLGATVERLAVR